MSNILWLGSRRSNLHLYLVSIGENVIYYEEPIGLNSPKIRNIDFIISYGYRHLIKKDILSKFYKKVINLHISYLPWNRGADPNFWSIVEDTPKGVTIHYIDEGLDTGDILVQKLVKLNKEDTLRTSYERLSKEIEDLFILNWLDIKSNRVQEISQNLKKGSFHLMRDKSEYEHLLSKGWDTPIIELLGIKKRKEDRL